MHLLTGEYSLTVSRGLLYLFDGATISGEGVNAPVVSVQGRGSLTLHNSSITANGNEAGAGGTALLLEDGVDFLVSNSAICSHGENAVGIRGLGDLDINTDSGVMMGRILWDSMPFRVQATGAGSVAIDAARNVAMLYGHISGDGAAVRAGGEITLDGCAVSPEVEGATLVKRTFVGSFAESSFFLQLGEDFVKENTGQSYFDIIHENTFLATADNAEAKWMWLRYRLEKTEIDVYTPGSYYIPITALAPCDAFDMLGDPPLRIAVYVMHPDIPYFGDAHLFEEIDEYTIGFELMGADIDKERHTLMVSYDEGESWEQFAWEDVRIAEGRWISIEMVGESFSGLLKITAPEGESNQIRVHATRSGFFYCGPPIGDRIGDSSGNQNPPADPEPQVPAEPQSPSLPQEQSPAFRPGITELPSDPSDPSGPPAPSSEQTGVSDSQTQGEAADNPARLPGAAVTGADLRTLLEVYSDYVPFLCGDVLVMLPAEALAALSIGEANVFAVRVEYLPGESLRILLTINNREITDWSQPFFASIPWDGAAPTLFDAAGNLLHCEFDAELGILRITFTSPGLVKLPEQEVAQMPEPLASFTESVLRPADNFAKTEAGGFPALYGILGVVGAGGVGGSVLWRRKWRRK